LVFTPGISNLASSGIRAPRVVMINCRASNAFAPLEEATIRAVGFSENSVVDTVQSNAFFIEPGKLIVQVDICLIAISNGQPFYDLFVYGAWPGATRYGEYIWDH
jgi:hypothetical protein